MTKRGPKLKDNIRRNWSEYLAEITSLSPEKEENPSRFSFKGYDPLFSTFGEVKGNAQRESELEYLGAGFKVSNDLPMIVMGNWVKGKNVYLDISFDPNSVKLANLDLLQLLPFEGRMERKDELFTGPKLSKHINYRLTPVSDERNREYGALTVHGERLIYERPQDLVPFMWKWYGDLTDKILTR